MADASGRTTIFLAALAVAWLAAGCSHPGPAPRIAFDATSIDLGAVDAGSSKEVRFPFRNTGARPLVIRNVDVSCGCLTPRFPEQVPPGGSGEIKVRFEPQPFWSGKVTKEVTVYTDDPRSRSLPLRLDADIIPYVRIEPPGPLEIEYQRGAVVQRELQLIPRQGTPISFKGVQSSSPLVKAALQPAAPGGPPGTVRLHLVVGPVPGWGDSTGSLQVGTSAPGLSVLPISFTLRAPNGPVVDPVQVNVPAVLPGSPGIVAGTGEQVLARLRVFTRAGALHLVSVETGTPLVQAQIEQEIPDKEYRVTLRSAGDWRPGAIDTSIRIRTDDPAFPEVGVPFEALVVQPPK
jgi:hypothetical protein